MPIKALTFDLDDTLWDVTPVLQRAEQELHAWLSARYPRLTRAFDIEMMRALRQELAVAYPEVGHNLSELRKASLRHAARVTGYPPALAEPAFEVFIKGRNRVTLYEDVLPVLERLSRRFSLGALSNGNADIERVGLAHVFDFALSAEQVGAAKPDPALFRSACRCSRATPGEVVHIGDDADRDIAGAAAVGLRTVWVNRRQTPWSGTVPPDAEIHSFFELEAVLSRWMNPRATGSQ